MADTKPNAEQQLTPKEIGPQEYVSPFLLTYCQYCGSGIVKDDRYVVAENKAAHLMCWITANRTKLELLLDTLDREEEEMTIWPETGERRGYPPAQRQDS